MTKYHIQSFGIILIFIIMQICEYNDTSVHEQIIFCLQLKLYQMEENIGQ